MCCQFNRTTTCTAVTTTSSTTTTTARWAFVTTSFFKSHGDPSRQFQLYSLYSCVSSTSRGSKDDVVAYATSSYGRYVCAEHLLQCCTDWITTSISLSTSRASGSSCRHHSTSFTRNTTSIISPTSCLGDSVSGAAGILVCDVRLKCSLCRVVAGNCKCKGPVHVGLAIFGKALQSVL